MFRALLLLTLASATLAAGTAAADVYRYKDEKGNIQYTDKPPALPAERLNVRTQRTDQVTVQERASAEQQRQQQAQASRARTTAQRLEEQQAKELTAKDKAERCTKARERYDTYMNSQRLFEQQPDGERRYLSDAELDAARASAKATMDVMCQ